MIDEFPDGHTGVGSLYEGYDMEEKACRTARVGRQWILVIAIRDCPSGDLAVRAP